MFGDPNFKKSFIAVSKKSVNGRLDFPSSPEMKLALRHVKNVQCEKIVDSINDPQTRDETKDLVFKQKHTCIFQVCFCFIFLPLTNTHILDYNSKSEKDSYLITK